jgi:hypothetical protein
MPIAKINGVEMVPNLQAFCAASKPDVVRHS